MKGFSAWPGQIISFTKSHTSAQIYFYGSHNIGRVDEAEIIPFNDAHQVIRLLLLRPNYFEFKKGIKEVEMKMNIPDNLSIINEERALN